MRKIDVTVIIPAYNAEKYIGRCLDSILKQEGVGFEILVINDGSSDKTGEIVKQYAKKFSEVRYVEQKNKGVAKTRNEAIEMARGEYVAFVDNDDCVDKDYLRKTLPRGGEDVVLGGYRRKNECGKTVREVKLSRAEWSKFVVPAPWAKIYRKKYLVDNKIEFLDNDIGEDVYFNLLAMLSTNKVRITNYVGYDWMINEKSVSNTKQKSFMNVNVFRLLDSCYDELKRRDLLEENYEVLELFFYRYIVWFLLFSSKRRKKAEIDVMYDKLFDWLEQRFPRYRKNRLLSGKLLGEIKSTRMAYKIFWGCQKVGLGKVLVWLYARL